MLQVQQLRFFDSKGHNCNFTYSDGYWSGKIHIDSISIGLIASSHIFILEEAVKSNGNRNYIYPEGDYPINASWVELDNTEISLFNVTIENDISYISKVEELSYLLDVDNGNITGDIRTSNEQDTRSLQINVSFSPIDENVFERTLILTHDSVKIAEISFYAESEGEDIRFKNMLHTLYGSVGDIDLEDSFIFRDADVENESVDYSLINKKRKQLLLEAHNIIPYIGADKGLVNIIEYFGYDDIDIKELWVNIDSTSENFNKKRMVQLPYQQIKQGSYTITEYIKPGNVWKKTSRFGLFYPINKDTGEVDEFGVPITEDSFLYSNEEILIKLFGLKEFLKEKFLPGNLRISSITGEGIYFERYKINSWSSQTEHYHIDLHRNVDFEILNPVGYIGDLRPYFNVPNPSSYPIDITPSLEPSLAPISIGTEKLGYYGYYDKKSYTDYRGIPVGYPLNLRVTTFDIKWEDATISFAEIDELKLKLDTVGIGDIYELEWIISKGSPKPYHTSIRGKATDLKDATFILPFAGIYDIELKLWDLDNNYSNEIKTGSVEVRSYEADFAMIYRKKDRGFTWRDIEKNKVSLNKRGTSVEYPYSNNTNFLNAKVKWTSLDLLTYLNEGELIYEGSSEIVHVDRSDEYITLPGTDIKHLKKGSWVKVQNDYNELPLIDRIPINSFDESLHSINIDNSYADDSIKHGVFTKIYPLYKIVDDDYTFSLDINTGILSIEKGCSGIETVDYNIDEIDINVENDIV